MQNFQAIALKLKRKWRKTEKSYKIVIQLDALRKSLESILVEARSLQLISETFHFKSHFT